MVPAAHAMQMPSRFTQQQVRPLSLSITHTHTRLQVRGLKSIIRVICNGGGRSQLGFALFTKAAHQAPSRHILHLFIKTLVWCSISVIAPFNITHTHTQLPSYYELPSYLPSMINGKSIPDISVPMQTWKMRNIYTKFEGFVESLTRRLRLGSFLDSCTP